MSYIMVVPSIYQPWTDACLRSCQLPADRIVVVDNTVENRGVAASWNIGRQRAIDEGAEWLVLCSAANRFGDAGGHDFIAELDNHPGAIAIEGGMGLGWHLIAFRVQTLVKVGKFDENLYPAYFEDLDYAWRISCAYGLVGPYWPKVIVDVLTAGFAHGIHLGGVTADDWCLRYMAQKWGDPKAPVYKHPFNNPANPIHFWPPTSRGGTCE